MKIIIKILLLIIIIISIIIGYNFYKFKEFSTKSLNNEGVLKTIIIPNGSGPQTISNILTKSGIIENTKWFYYYLRWQTKNRGLAKAGEYEVASKFSPKQIVDILISGKIKLISITIPEGYNMFEIADLLESSNITKKQLFLNLVQNKQYISNLGVEADSLDGYLFPETYKFAKNSSAKTVVEKMFKSYKQIFNKFIKHKLAKFNMSENTVLALASLIEKESAVSNERTMISGVFHNRVKKKMKIQSDPTIIYSILLERGTFDGNIKKSDIRMNHPYNTYYIRGLPPGAIANPGKESLIAAVNPQKTDNLFFVSKNDGTHEFCPNLKCHNKAVLKWQVNYFRGKK